MYKNELNGNVLTIILEGSIDSINAQEKEAEIFEITKGKEFSNLVLDALSLVYISSAGLRIILKLMKTYKNMEIVNVSNEVYDIFDMTGFTKMVKVKKAFRTIELENAVKIGEGARGIVYRYKEDMIVKVYKGQDVLAQIQRERELAQKAFVLGIPTAISYDVVKVGNNFGTVFELLNAKSMSDKIIEDSGNLDEYAKIFTSLLKTIHSTSVTTDGMHSEMDVVKVWLGNAKNVLDEDTYNKACALVSTIKESNTLIHGDFHTNNIMLQDGEALLIDMDTLSYGNPILEFAIIDFTYNTFSLYEENNSKQFLGIDKDTAFKFYDLVIKYYFDGKDKSVIERNQKRIEFLCSLRIINHVYKRSKDMNILNKVGENIKSLLNEINDLNLE